METTTRVYSVAQISAAFILCGLGTWLTLRLQGASIYWVGPAGGDAVMFGIVGFQMLFNVGAPNRVNIHFKNLLGANALGCVTLAIYFAIKHLHIIPASDDMLGFGCLVAVGIGAFVLQRAYRKLRGGIEPFGPKSTV